MPPPSSDHSSLRAACRRHRTHKGAMDPRLLAFEAARRQFVDGDATAAARDLAHAFGAVHPEAGTLRAIHAVIDQLDNPSSFARNRDAYEKHGASQGTFNKWKKKLRPSSLKKLTRPSSRNFTKSDARRPVCTALVS